MGSGTIARLVKKCLHKYFHLPCLSCRIFFKNFGFPFPAKKWKKTERVVARNEKEEGCNKPRRFFSSFHTEMRWMDGCRQAGSPKRKTLTASCCCSFRRGKKKKRKDHDNDEEEEESVRAAWVWVWRGIEQGKGTNERWQHLHRSQSSPHSSSFFFPPSSFPIPLSSRSFPPLSSLRGQVRGQEDFLPRLSFGRGMGRRKKDIAAVAALSVLLLPLLASG